MKFCPDGMKWANPIYREIRIRIFAISEIVDGIGSLILGHAMPNTQLKTIVWFIRRERNWKWAQRSK